MMIRKKGESPAVVKPGQGILQQYRPENFIFSFVFTKSRKPSHQGRCKQSQNQNTRGPVRKKGKKGRQEAYKRNRRDGQTDPY